MYSSLLLSLSPGTRNWRANFVSRPLAIERSFLVKAITIQFDRLSASRMKTKSNSWLVSLFAPYFCGSFRFGSIDVFNYSVSASFLYFVAFEMFGLTNEMSKLPQSSLIRIVLYILIYSCDENWLRSSFQAFSRVDATCSIFLMRC